MQSVIELGRYIRDVKVLPTKVLSLSPLSLSLSLPLSFPLLSWLYTCRYIPLAYKRSEIMDLQLTNQIPDLLYPTIPYNTLQYLHVYYHNIVVTSTVIRLVTQRPETMTSEVK